MAARCPSGGRTRRANIRRHGRDDESGGRRIGVCPWQPRQAGVDGRPGSAGSGSGPWRCGDRLPRGSTGTRSEVSRGRRRARDSASGRRLRGPGSANGQSKDGCGGSEVKRMGADVRSKRPRSHTVALRFARGRPGSQGGIVRGVASCRDRFPGFPTGS
jgi:hypothetical protein